MKLVVVGGGIAGLAAAHRAVELSRERGVGLELTLLEAQERLGGTIRTERRDGFLVEAGPDSFISEKPWALELARRLGAESRLVRTDEASRRTFVAWRGRLHPLPEGFQLLAPTRLRPLLASSLFSWPGKLRMGLDLVLPRGGDPDESLGAFVRRRLGREALERVAQPLVAGIYTADPDTLSLAATMPRFLEIERRERSVVMGMWRAARKAGAAAKGASGARWSLFVTLAGGMEELVRMLAERLPEGAVRLGERVTGIARAGAGWRIAAASGATFDADAVILACESYQAARMLRYLDPSLALLLEDIPVRVVRRRHAGLPAGRRRAPAGRLRLRGAARGGAAHHRVHVLEREVRGPGPRRPRAAARVRGGRAGRGGPGCRRRAPDRPGARAARRAPGRAR